MGITTRVAIIHQRALNQAMLYAGRIPARAFLEPPILLRALRSALRMSQAQLARRAGLPQAHIARLEAGTIDLHLGTLRKLLDAMFCDLLILPLPRKRPSDVLAERRIERHAWQRDWD